MTHAENSSTDAATANKSRKAGLDLERLASMTLEELLYFILVGAGRVLPPRTAIL